MDLKIKSILIRGLIAIPLICVLGLVLRTQELYLGATLGAALSVLDFFLIQKDAYAVVASGQEARKTATFRYLRRYAIIFGVLLLAATLGFRAFIGLFMGLFVVKGIIIFDNLVVGYAEKVLQKFKSIE